jgi:hypothetical protein
MRDARWVVLKVFGFRRRHGQSPIKNVHLEDSVCVLVDIAHATRNLSPWRLRRVSGRRLISDAVEINFRTPPYLGYISRAITRNLPTCSQLSTSNSRKVTHANIHQTCHVFNYLCFALVCQPARSSGDTTTDGRLRAQGVEGRSSPTSRGGLCGRRRTESRHGREFPQVLSEQIPC